MRGLPQHVSNANGGSGSQTNLELSMTIPDQLSHPFTPQTPPSQAENINGNEQADDDELEEEDRPKGDEPEDRYSDPEPQDDTMNDISFNFPAHPFQSSNEGELPRSSIPALQLSQDMIDAIQNATLAQDLDDNLLDQIRNPSKDIDEIDQLSKLLMRMFTTLNNSSQQTYADVEEALLWFDPSIEMDFTLLPRRNLRRRWVRSRT